jgi:hypothetical protein
LAFVPPTTCGDVEVVFEVPAASDLFGHNAVIFEQLVLAENEAPVAEHTDPHDAAQQMFFPAISTEMIVQATEREETAENESTSRNGHDALGLRPGRHIASADDQIMDVVRYEGLAPNRPYRAELTIYERDPNGNCLPTGLVQSQNFTSTESSGIVTITGIRVPDSGVYVGYERIYAISSNDDTLVAAHENCDDRAQTVWTPGMQTAVVDSVVIGPGTMNDTITVIGLADGLAEGVNVVIEGSLHKHDQSDRSEWVCRPDNRVGEFVVDVSADGEYRSPGESHGIGWYSYANRFVLTFADGTTWESERFGCQVQAESFEVRTPREMPTSTAPTATTQPPFVAKPPVAPPPPPPPPSSSIAPPPADLPRTGNTYSGTIQLVAVLLVLAGGALFLVTPALPLQHRKRLSSWYRRLRSRQR